MIPAVREHFNQQFTEQKYHELVMDIERQFNIKIPFRIAETPVFVGREFKQKLLQASGEIIDFIVRPDFKQSMEGAVPDHLRVPNDDQQPLFLALDFAVCTEGSNELVPKLIEIQGFPSLFGYQDLLGNTFRQHYSLPDNFDFHFGATSTEYWDQLRTAILRQHDPEHVILLEIDPFKQNTTIDFLVTQNHLGIEPVHIGDLIIRGRKLFYRKQGKEIPVHRIYNRVIFDELQNRIDFKTDYHLTEDVEVEWAGHPNWFFRISKYTMPFLKSSAVPDSRFLKDYAAIPADLENYVLKPLFSFSGSGVIFNVKKADIEAIPLQERCNYLLQQKVHYEPVIRSPDGLVKTEIRLLFLWVEGSPRPRLVTNLARLSRGEIIGVKYNKDKTWVGGSICFFEN